MITKLNFTDHTIKSYAIRKLTPKECFRLMGVRDNVIGTMQSSNAQAAERLPGWKGKGKPEDMAISASQQYKQAGNSIVVDVLAAIYEQLWYHKTDTQQDRQLSLFPDYDIPTAPPKSDKEKIIISTFSGYDSQLLAADLLAQRHPDFRYTCAGWCEIDKYASQMHNLIFPQFADRALGDITKIDWHEVKSSLQGREVDLLTYSSPCQDISQAGKQMGLQQGSGTRSSLLWNVADAIQVLRPKYLLQENVAALVSKKFMPDFQQWLDKLSSIGYISKWQRLNSRNYGVPQNRDRVFCISMRRDVAFDYQFPAPFELLTRLEDVLEEEVSDRYFLKDDAVSKFLKANDTDNALFLQFDLPPTHEAAMFLKTWLRNHINTINGWDMELDELADSIEGMRLVFDSYWKSFCNYHTFPFEGFEELFKENMERKKDGK